MDFEDIVTLKSRTGEQVAIMIDSRERYVDPKKGLKVPRAMAELGIKQHAFLWDETNGMVKESLVYIEDDIDTPLALPHKKVNLEEISKVKKTDGLGKDKAFIDGKFIPMKTVELNPGKENFAANSI